MVSWSVGKCIAKIGFINLSIFSTIDSRSNRMLIIGFVLYGASLAA